VWCIGCLEVAGGGRVLDDATTMSSQLAGETKKTIYQFVGVSDGGVISLYGASL
jgi:hypothetical protein